MDRLISPGCRQGNVVRGRTWGKDRIAPGLYLLCKGVYALEASTNVHQLRRSSWSSASAQVPDEEELRPCARGRVGPYGVPTATEESDDFYAVDALSSDGVVPPRQKRESSHILEYVTRFSVYFIVF